MKKITCQLVLFLILISTKSLCQNYSMAAVNLRLADLAYTSSGGGGGTISMINNVFTVKFSAGWNNAPMKVGIIKTLNCTPPLTDLDLGPILDSKSQPSHYNARIVNNNLEFYSPSGYHSVLTGCNFTFSKTFATSGTSTNHLLVFEYDNAGNQVQRFVKVSSNLGRTAKSSITEIAAVNEENWLNVLPAESISYYPNPVKEELFLQWELTNDNHVTAIQVFLLSGQLLQTYAGLERHNTHTIPFQTYPSGVYIIVLNYKNGDPKSIKIIKQ